MKFKSYWILETKSEDIKSAKEEIRKLFNKINKLENQTLCLDNDKHKHAWIDESDL